MKPEVVFGLDNAAWPALLVSPGGVVLMSNAAAHTVFGAGLNGGQPNLAAVWSAANGPAAPAFLEAWEKSPAVPVDLKFRAAGGMEKKFSAVIAVLASEGHKWFVLQLLSLPAAPPLRPRPLPSRWKATPNSAMRRGMWP